MVNDVEIKNILTSRLAGTGLLDPPTKEEIKAGMAVSPLRAKIDYYISGIPFYILKPFPRKMRIKIWNRIWNRRQCS